MRTIIRILIGAQALFMIAVGMGFLLAPDRLGAAFFLAPTSPVGEATLRADMFGFFVGGSLFALFAAWRGIALPLLVPIVLLCAAVFGRLVNLFVAGPVPGSFPPLVIELVMLAVLFTGYRVLGLTRK
jgi:hypothetical protein